MWEISELFEIENGLGQGVGVSPLLFNRHHRTSLIKYATNCGIFAEVPIAHIFEYL